jgi:hypothetical protein
MPWRGAALSICQDQFKTVIAGLDPAIQEAA